MTKIQDDLIDTQIRLLESQLRLLKSGLETVRSFPDGDKVELVRQVLERLQLVQSDADTLWKDIVSTYPKEVGKLKKGS